MNIIYTVRQTSLCIICIIYAGFLIHMAEGLTNPPHVYRVKYYTNDILFYICTFISFRNFV